MLTEERQQAIATYINKHSICRVNELCKLTKSSESTIRRDLIELEKRGVIVRVHGGARSLQDYSRDVEQQVRFNLNVDNKRAISRLLSTLIMLLMEIIFFLMLERQLMKWCHSCEKLMIYM